jgi:hypothetical protein
MTAMGTSKRDLYVMKLGVTYKSRILFGQVSDYWLLRKEIFQHSSVITVATCVSNYVLLYSYVVI